MGYNFEIQLQLLSVFDESSLESLVKINFNSVVSSGCFRDVKVSNNFCIIGANKRHLVGMEILADISELQKSINSIFHLFIQFIQNRFILKSNFSH